MTAVRAHALRRRASQFRRRIQAFRRHVHQFRKPVQRFSTSVQHFGARVRKLWLFPPSTLGAHAFAAFGGAVAALGDHAATQFSGRGSAREGTASKAVAREALRDDLDAIVRTARALALDMPGIDDKFRPPRGSGDQTVLHAADFIKQDMLSVCFWASVCTVSPGA